MQAEFAHEQAQSFLRQRNRFAVLAGVLGLTTLVTRSAELVFGLPDDLNYSKNGMIYGARLFESTKSLRIADPEFATNFDEHVQQCVFYDLLLGRYSMKELSESDDIWARIAPGSAARAQQFLTRQW